MSNHRKILIVDDEVVIADTLAEILKQHGFEVYVAYSGTSALKVALMIEPDLVISDVMMPDKDGIEVAVEIAAMLPKCITLLYSGSATSANLLNMARESGYKGEILSKPIHPTDLLVRINGLA